MKAKRPTYHRTAHMAQRVAQIVDTIGEANVSDVHAHCLTHSYQNIYGALERATTMNLIHRVGTDDAGRPSYAPGRAPSRARYPSVWAYGQGVAV